MPITAQDVMKLRQATGLGMMECKNALAETDGNVDQAVDLLRQRGLAKMAGRSERTSAQGRVAAVVSADAAKGAIVEINTETDFTANNDAFKAMASRVATLALEQPVGDAAKTDAMQKAIDDVRLTTKENVQFARARVIGGNAGKVGAYNHFTGQIGVLVEVTGDVSDELLTDLCMHVAAASPSPIAVKEDEVPAETIEHEKKIAKAQAIEQGKPEQIAEKMVIGKIRKFYEENVLLKQAFIKDDKKRIEELLPKGATIKSFVRYQVGMR